MVVDRPDGQKELTGDVTARNSTRRQLRNLKFPVGQRDVGQLRYVAGGNSPFDVLRQEFRSTSEAVRRTEVTDRQVVKSAAAGRFPRKPIRPQSGNAASFVVAMAGLNPVSPKTLSALTDYATGG